MASVKRGALLGAGVHAVPHTYLSVCPGLSFSLFLSSAALFFMFFFFRFLPFSPVVLIFPGFSFVTSFSSLPRAS